MYIITSKTSNEITVGVVKNGTKSYEKLTNKFQTALSDEITESMSHLSNIGVISYGCTEDIDRTAEIVVEEKPAEVQPTSRRGRHASNTSDANNTSNDDQIKED